MKDEVDQHEYLRKKLWIDVYVAYVGAANSSKRDGAYSWANLALERFDAAFPKLPPQPQTLPPFKVTGTI